MIHINTKLGDYVLDLLPRRERREVELHVAHCADCEAALASEKAVGRLLRGTLSSVTQPDNGRLRQLMPTLPTQKQRPAFNFSWQRQLASVCVMLILLIGGFGWYESNQNRNLMPLPTFVAITATYTSEPTITNTATTVKATAEPTVTAVSENPAPDFNATPPPNPTPIAALSTFSN
ncbi:MAG: hypothetical protein DWQ04_03465 [Chloroflexi bacterium]|nr:MAG: hypothetical protein DWQ04_03465 [Chloroflexota bacterium]